MTAKKEARLVGKLIKEVRLARGLSLGELARKCYMDSSTLSRIESRGHLPPLHTIQAIAKALDCTAYVVFEESSCGEVPVE